MKQIYCIKPPCSQCPYTLGMVHTFKNPCPQCKASGYQMFEHFQKRLPGTDPAYEMKNNQVHNSEILRKMAKFMLLVCPG